jgi:hypothetical protein
MYNIAKLSNEERTIIFLNTAAKKGMNEAIIEKDFWVCLTLDYLFHKNKWKNHYAFKGGTSLSKTYGLIERFSEDIDLILDWRVLGYDKNYPWENRSKSKQLVFNKEVNQKASDFLKNKFVQLFKKDIEELIETEVSIYINEDDPQTVNFDYPCLFTESTILRTIRLEIGSLGVWSPVILNPIKSYVAEEYEQIFNQPVTYILTTYAERSFWEKATILHHEAHRPETSKFQIRYSRHYYDLYCIGKSKYKQLALEKIELLEQVAMFKYKFYPRIWAKYEEARPGTLKLMPPSYNLKDLNSDYLNMKNMIYGVYPSFNEILTFIQQLENEINQL